MSEGASPSPPWKSPYDGVKTKIDFVRPHERLVCNAHTPIKTVFAVDTIERASTHEGKIALDAGTIGKAKDHALTLNTG